MNDNIICCHFTSRDINSSDPQNPDIRWVCVGEIADGPSIVHFATSGTSTGLRKNREPLYTAPKTVEALLIRIEKAVMYLNHRASAKYIRLRDAENPAFPVSNWKCDVANDNTKLGYADWVKHNLEAAS